MSFMGQRIVMRRISTSASVRLFSGQLVGQWKDKMAVGSVTALLISFARPEFFLAYMLLLLAFVGVVLYDILKARRFRVSALLAILAISAILLSVFGLPFGGGGRSLMAFGQHFALHWVEREQSPLSPWTQWEEIIKANFGDATGLLSLIMANPREFGLHIAANLRRLFIPLGAWPRGVFFGIATLLLGCRALITLSKRRDHVGQHHALNTWRTLLVMSCLIAPTIASVTLVYPRRHYVLLIVAVLVVVYCSVLLPQRRWQVCRWEIVLCSVLLLAFFVRPPNAKRYLQSNLAVINAIRELEVDTPVRILEADGGYAFYTGPNYTRVSETAKDCGFREFCTREGVNMIVVSKLLSSDPRFSGDPEWGSFCQDLQQHGFENVPVHSQERSLFVKSTLLASSP